MGFPGDLLDASVDRRLSADVACGRSERPAMPDFLRQRAPADPIQSPADAQPRPAEDCPRRIQESTLAVAVEGEGEGEAGVPRFPASPSA